MAKPLENVAFWLPGLGPPASSRGSPSRRVSERTRSKEEIGASPVSRQSSLRSKERPLPEPPIPSQSSRLKLTCPVKLPSLGRSPRGSQTAREMRARQPSKESKGSPIRQSSLEPAQARKPKSRSATGPLEASPAHSMSMLSTDSTDASPHVSYEVLRMAEEATIPGMPTRGSIIDAASQSDGGSSRSSPSLDMAEKSDVEDVNDLKDRSFSLEGIPDLELVRASPVPEKQEGYAGGVQPDAPSPGSLQIPKAKSLVPTRAWGSTATVDPSKDDSSPTGSPLKAKRSYRRHQTSPPGRSSRSGSDELIARTIDSLDGRKIYDVYYWEEVIQEDGDGGKVVVCRKKVTGSEGNNGEFDKVMKIKSKLKLKKEGCAEEYRKVLLKMLSLPAHPGVMPVEEALEDDAFYYVVTPRATSSFFDGLLGEFHDGVVPESALRSLMTDMLEAVDHLHNHGVLHRDIKPDNMVLQTRVDEETGEKRRRVVLIDFDHADPDFHNNADDQERIYGTRRFNAPECYLCSFSRQTDLYSIGVIFYMLMTGKMPYDDEIFDGIKPPGSRMVSPRALLHDTFQRLKDADIDWNCDPWPSQPLSMDLCRQLLAFNPALRPSSARQALGHAWFLD